MQKIPREHQFVQIARAVPFAFKCLLPGGVASWFPSLYREFYTIKERIQLF